MEQVRSFDLFMYVGGYWSKRETYHGGEVREIGKMASDNFTIRSVFTLIKEFLGYDDNMKKMSWFPPNDEMNKKEDIEDDIIMRKVVDNAVSVGAMTLYVVREDDPYISRHKAAELGLEKNFSEDDILSSESGDVNLEHENDDDQEQYDDAVDAIVGQFMEPNESSSEDENDADAVLDENNYQKFKLGQEYRSIESFKTAVTRYAVRKKRDIKLFKSDNKRVVAICSDGRCPWRISASINSSSVRVVVRSFKGEHNCSWQGKVSLLTNARLAELYLEEFRINPNISAKQLQKKLLKRNINVAETICERTRLRCLKIFDEEQAESFARFFDYVDILKKTNPGSTVECEVRGTTFSRFYVAFHALKDGWKAACRRIIHIDGTFLKWRMSGILLVACGRDPNDQMFPIAWAVVDVENKPNWEWFFQHLADDLELGTGNGLTLASDQCKGLVAAVKDVLPYAEHRLCARHVHANWKKKHSGADFEDLFWGAADAYYPTAFKKKMEELKILSPAAFDDLKLNIVSPWSRAFFSEFAKCDVVENNLGESFNATIRIARTKPVVEMLEEIRKCVILGNEKKRSEAEKAKGEYTPKSIALLDEQIEKTKNCIPLSCGRGEYEVGYFNDRYVVKMRGGVDCSCRMYLISGIPCCHIISALRQEKQADQDPKSLICEMFTVNRLKRCYASSLRSVPGLNQWEKTTNIRVQPPPYKRPPGRPPGKKRKREKGEPRPGKVSKRGTKIHCHTCGQEGHNKLHCKNEPVPKPPKKPPGRPRKTPAVCPLSSDGAHIQHQIAQSQPLEDLPSISSALPRKGRGRPRKPQSDVGGSSSQPLPPMEPIYDTGPTHIPMQGVGLFTSTFTGDDYIHLGRSVRDTSDNTILPSSLYEARERKKMQLRSDKRKNK